MWLTYRTFQSNFLDNKLSDEHLASELVDNGSFLNQLQSNKLQLYDWLS